MTISSGENPSSRQDLVPGELSELDNKHFQTRKERH